MKTSARNHFAGTVQAVHSGAVNDEVEIKIDGGHTIVATLTQTSTKSLGLAQGKPAFAKCAAIRAPIVPAPNTTAFSMRRFMTRLIVREFVPQDRLQNRQAPVKPPVKPTDFPRQLP